MWILIELRSTWVISPVPPNVKRTILKSFTFKPGRSHKGDKGHTHWPSFSFTTHTLLYSVASMMILACFVFKLVLWNEWVTGKRRVTFAKITTVVVCGDIFLKMARYGIFLKSQHLYPVRNHSTVVGSVDFGGCLAQTQIRPLPKIPVWPRARTQPSANLVTSTFQVRPPLLSAIAVRRNWICDYKALRSPCCY